MTQLGRQLIDRLLEQCLFILVLSLLKLELGSKRLQGRLVLRLRLGPPFLHLRLNLSFLVRVRLFQLGAFQLSSRDGVFEFLEATQLLLELRLESLLMVALDGSDLGFVLSGELLAALFGVIDAALRDRDVLLGRRKGCLEFLEAIRHLSRTTGTHINEKGIFVSEVGTSLEDRTLWGTSLTFSSIA